MAGDPRPARPMLEGRVAIVTGSGRGVGRAHALELARHGAAVVVNDPGVGVHGEPTAERPAQEVVAEITAAGGRAVASFDSVADFAGARAIVEQAVDAFGRLDVVVNNAGILRDGPLTAMTEADFDAVIGVHLKGTFNVTKHAGDHWVAVAEGGGVNDARVINTTSGAGLYGNAFQTVYAAAKAGIVGLTLSTALELRRHGVTANAISPVAYTRMLHSSGVDRAAVEGFDPLDPANNAGVVAYLASPASAWITGQVLRIEGRTLHRMQGYTGGGTYTSRKGGRLSAGELVDGMARLWGTMPPGLDLPRLGFDPR